MRIWGPPRRLLSLSQLTQELPLTQPSPTTKPLSEYGLTALDNGAYQGTNDNQSPANQIQRSYFDSDAFSRVMDSNGTLYGRTGVAASPTGLIISDTSGGQATNTMNHRTLMFGEEMVAQAFCGDSNMFDSSGSVDVGFRPDCVFFIASELKDTLNSAIRQSYGCLARDIGVDNIAERNRVITWSARTSLTVTSSTRFQNGVAMIADENGVLARAEAAFTNTGFSWVLTGIYNNAPVGYLAIKWQPGISQRLTNANLASGATDIIQTALGKPCIGYNLFMGDMGGLGAGTISTAGNAWTNTFAYDPTESGLAGQPLTHAQIAYTNRSNANPSNTHTYRGAARRLLDRDGTIYQAATMTTSAEGFTWDGFPSTPAYQLQGWANIWGLDDPPIAKNIFLGSDPVRQIVYQGKYIQQVYQGSTKIYP